ncbi:hypothetical protein BV898_02819 [Hypsibius exemplaris]|uniref:Uncharacterized protein n=1 Tax=Hypsibius exemplaris TaxID=2072580 RepID=A0A1W0X797_HYPEX|nr:hypothetical protein BV898_02819 [Hypsibius exemplaris]
MATNGESVQRVFRRISSIRQSLLHHGNLERASILPGTKQRDGTSSGGTQPEFSRKMASWVPRVLMKHLTACGSKRRSAHVQEDHG